MDDLRLGRLARALRHRLGIPQREVARRADTSQSALSRLERGRFAGMTVGRIRRILAVYDAELVQYVRWRGGDIDRLLDRGHAELGERVAALLESLGWTVVAEVSYSIFGERGSIDLLAWHPASRVLLVIEIKTELTSIEETLRRHDVKVRLARRIASERFAWEATDVIRMIVLPDQRTPRRHVERHASLFARTYPLRSWALKRWLADPGAVAGEGAKAAGSAQAAGPVGAVGGMDRSVRGGLLFLPMNHEVRGGRGPIGRKRVH